MTWRIYIQLTVLVVINLGACFPLLAGQDEKGPPNILLILADDIGREVLGCYGGQSYATPNLDRLAAGGMRFQTCYATPICSPTRVQILTGRYSFRNYTRWRQLDPNETTFAQLLQKGGYRTAIAGKWQLEGWGQTPKAIRKAGFDEYLSFDYPLLNDFAKRGEGNVYWKNPTLWHNDQRREAGNRYGEDIFYEFAAEFMTRHSSRPWLMYFNMNLCHRPFMPTPDSTVMQSDSDANIDQFIGFEGETHYFDDMAAYADKLVGQFIDLLEKTGQHKRTLVIFTADNGTDNVWEATSLRSKYKGRMVEGGKYKVSDLGVNVPFIVNWPGVIAPGQVEEDLVDFSDILPTLCEAAGVNISDDLPIDGRSFLPLLKGGEYHPRQWVYSWGGFIKTSRRYKDPASYKDEHIHVIRNHRWKYYSDGRLFDMQQDPFEEYPLLPAEGSGAGQAAGFLKNQLRQLRSSGEVLW